MVKPSRFSKLPWWLQAIAGAGRNAQSPLTGAPSVRAMKRAARDPEELQRRLDELFDGSPIVRFYPVHAGVKPHDLLIGADARGYERQPSEQVGEWTLEVYALKTTDPE